MSEVSVVYAGPLTPGGTCLHRLDILQNMGLRVYPFDIGPRFRSLSSFRRMAESLLFYGPVFQAINRDFIRFTETHSPTVVWVDKGFWLWPSTVDRFRRKGFFLVHHNTDALFPRRFSYRWSYLLIRQTLSGFHLYLTSNRLDYERLAPRPFPQTELTYLGYDKTRFHPAATERQGMIFIGHHEPRNERYIRSLVAADLPVKVYGAGWSRRRSLPGLAKVVQADAVRDDEYVSLIQGAKVGLGFVSEINGNETAGRCFEIPACGTFLLAPRTRQLQDLYREGEEAVFFGSPEELVDKARRYLIRDEGEREAIAHRGRERCLSSDYSWERFMREDWNRVVKALGARFIPAGETVPCG